LVRTGVPQERVEIIPDGVEIPGLLPDNALRARARAAWGFGADEFVVGHLGACTHEKGQGLAVEASRLLARKLPQVRLLLAGDVSGPAREALPANVRVLGYPEDLEEFWAGLDLYLMPSRAEGLGSSALLAMAHGLAVVATRVGGLPEIVEEGRTGWLVPADCPVALAEAIEEAASDPTVLAQFGLKARETARLFSSDIMLDRTEALYRRLLAGTVETTR
jgi:glycosyltransferase involved in cell wall biosynthesis